MPCYKNAMNVCRKGGMTSDGWLQPDIPTLFDEYVLADVKFKTPASLDSRRELIRAFDSIGHNTRPNLSKVLLLLHHYYF